MSDDTAKTTLSDWVVCMRKVMRLVLICWKDRRRELEDEDQDQNLLILVVASGRGGQRTSMRNGSGGAGGSMCRPHPQKKTWLPAASAAKVQVHGLTGNNAAFPH